MSVPFVPGLEQGTNLEGNIELSLADLKTIQFSANREFKQEKVNQSSISDFGDQAFLLHNVFLKEECKTLIEQGESLGFDRIRGVREDYRNCMRMTIKSLELADILWARIKDYLHDIIIEEDPHKLHIHGPPAMMKGTWVPIGLNNIFRFCRYLPGGHFAPHFDGHYDQSPQVRSLKTFMIYLNGDFTGGSTNFVDEKQTLYKDETTGRFCAEKDNILCSVKPEAGLAIIFNHHRLHEGAALGDGKKYILRTDIMFKNASQNYSQEYAEALSLLQKAETLEGCIWMILLQMTIENIETKREMAPYAANSVEINAGECMKAASMYRKAFKLAPELEFST